MIRSVKDDNAATGDIHAPGSGGVVFLPVGENDEPRDRTISLKKRVKLHCSLCLSEPCPGKDRETELEERRIEDVEFFAEF